MKNFINSVKEFFASMYERVSSNSDSLANVGVILAYVTFLALVIGISPVTYTTVLLVTAYLLVSTEIADIMTAIVGGVIMSTITLLLSIAIKPWFVAFCLVGVAMYYTELGRLVTLKVVRAMLALIKK